MGVIDFCVTIFRERVYKCSLQGPLGPSPKAPGFRAEWAPLGSQKNPRVNMVTQKSITPLPHPRIHP
jgi:hypothetical protein